jgi:pimeloyl-ACP methyl ester carboxylesterase
LKNEEKLFKEYLDNSLYSVAGFSYGAIKAFEYTYKTNSRIDTLILLSPAFFQNKDEKFKRLQLLNFKKDGKKYIENFLKNIAYPSTIELKKYLFEGSYQELSKLLNYVWDEKRLQSIVDKGIDIEVYLGEKDKILDTKEIYNFFKPYATIHYYKNKGHILCKL